MTELLDLNGKDLERELERIIKENPTPKKRWSEKEIGILKRLHEKGVPRKVIAKQLGRSTKAVDDMLSNL